MKKKRTSDKVFDYIKEKIIDKTWQPGDKITPELQLVEELEVSRMSVREAIEKLAGMNILEKKRGGGTFVKEVHPSEYMDDLIPLLMVGKINYEQILEFRSAIDVLAVRLFIERASEEELKNLRRNYQDMVENKGNREKFLEFDLEFHKIISEGSKNPIISKVISMIFDIMEVQTRDEYHKLTPDERIVEHGKILGAIEIKDIELAELYMKRHLERTLGDLNKLK